MAGESQGRSRQCLDESGTSMYDVLPCIDKVGINRVVQYAVVSYRCLMSSSRSDTEILFFFFREKDQMWKFVYVSAIRLIADKKSH